MSDQHSPNGASPHPDDALDDVGEIEVRVSGQPRRRRTPAPPAPPAPPEQPQQQPVEIPIAGVPPVSATDAAVEVPIGGAAPAQAHYWPADEAAVGVAPPAAVTPDPADALYEVELEIRNRSEQSTGRPAEMGAMAAGVLQLIGENMRRLGTEQAARAAELLRGVDLKDYLDPAFWQGVGMVLRYQLDETVALVRRRLKGEYSTDPYGMDREAIELVRPFLRFMYRSWWRVSVEGLEHVPAAGRALLVANHSGVLPWDGAMIAAAVAEDHPAQNERIVRSLHLHWFSTLPFIAPALAAMGQVPGLPENAVRLLEDDELVAVFPEGLKGVGKLYKDRYKLARFGRGGFVQVALRAQAPIVPVAVVGAEEIYPMLANAEPIAKLFGMPYFPLTPFFPWLGPLGVIPLPTRWSITFCEPIRTDEYDPAAADDPLTVLGLTELVRERIQATIDAKLAERSSVF